MKQAGAATHHTRLMMTMTDRYITTVYEIREVPGLRGVRFTTWEPLPLDDVRQEPPTEQRQQP